MNDLFHGDEPAIAAERAELTWERNNHLADDWDDAEVWEITKCPDCGAIDGFTEMRDIVNMPALRCKCGCEWWDWRKAK